MSCWTDAAWNAANEHYSVVLFHQETIIRAAAVPHTCTTCRATIAVADPYVRIVGMTKGDEYPYVVKQCENCW